MQNEEKGGILKSYFYHRVREYMVGNILYPLNQLKDIYPEAHALAIKKYEGRESLMQKEIPLLNCLWNDVIFMSPIHPSVVDNELRLSGYKPLQLPYYEIDLALLDQSLLVAYTPGRGEKGCTDQWKLFDESRMIEYQIFPETARTYYGEKWNAGCLRNQIFPYCYITHILYKGQINIEDCGIIRN